jgi:hypothetical protein
MANGLKYNRYRFESRNIAVFLGMFFLLCNLSVSLTIDNDSVFNDLEKQDSASRLCPQLNTISSPSIILERNKHKKSNPSHHLLNVTAGIWGTTECGGFPHALLGAITLFRDNHQLAFLRLDLPPPLHSLLQ